MGGDEGALFTKYPVLKSLRRFASDSFIYEEIGSRAKEFEHWMAISQDLIPVVNLNEVFPAELETSPIRMEHFLGHWGNTSIEDTAKICLITKWLAPKRILEIGTYNGMMTLQMALNAPPECIIYTLDLTPEQAAILPLSKLDELVAKQFLGQTGSYFRDRADLNIHQLYGNSTEFDFSVIGGKADLIYINGSGDYKSVCTDTATAFRLLSERGVILWHNYADVHYPDITRCLVETARHHKLASEEHLSGGLFHR